MMYIHFLVIKGACIKIPAIKDDFLFENITLMYIHHVGLCVEFELPCFTIILQIKDMYSRSSSSHFF